MAHTFIFRPFLLPLLLPHLVYSGPLIGDACALPHEAWAFPPSGLLLSTQASLCAQLDVWPPLTTAGTPVHLAPCNASNPAQLFTHLPSNATIVLTALPSHCLNLEAYGTSPGTPAWVTGCDSAACKGNCAWDSTPGGALSNSGLCLQDGTPAPPLPHTCAPGSPSQGLPFCNPVLPVESRVDDLLSRFSAADKVGLWNMGLGGVVFNASMNLKAVHWDFTCIHGINYPSGMTGVPPLFVSVFPHAIAQAATFDTPLVTALSAATAYEARAVNQVVYRETGGRLWAGTNCDGGPLANTAHDPRWGRISECYGEDPKLAATIGVAAMLALQNRSADNRWLGTSQVTRHWLGYHFANDLPRGGEETISPHAFADQQSPVYRALQMEGGAEGLMCAYASFSVNGGEMTPSCVHPWLWEKLREEWGWDGFVQTDCCDSITSMVEQHQYYPNLATAALNAIEMGVSLFFGFNGAVVDAVSGLLASGQLDAGLFDDRLRRTLLTRFRMGEFDAGGGNRDYPYSAAYDESQLDGPAHRALSRAAAAASVVLLENDAGVLPLALAPGSTLAIIGPFADCTATMQNDADSPLLCSYEHTYAGTGGPVSTPLSAAREEGAARGWAVRYAQGSNIVSAFGSDGLAAATALAATANATLLVLGLGTLLEVECTDRTTLRLPAAQEALLAAVLGSAHGPVILAIVSAGMVDADFAAAAAALQLFYPGGETGHGLFDVLVGRVAPSGRLPLTAYKEEYLGALHDSIADFNMVSSTGVGRTHRYLTNATLVNYWFGYGLSYAPFVYSNLNVSLLSRPGPGAPPNTPFARITAAVANGGGAAAAEIAQCYVAVPSDSAAAAAVGGAPIPRHGLGGFFKTAVLHTGAGAVDLEWVLPLEAFLTTTAGGERVFTGGNYTITVAGHAPGDVKGRKGSNELQQVVVL